MRYGSVCSGIEAATAAWHHMGWQAAFFSEIEAFPRAVLAHHYPDVPCHGDFTTIGADQYGPIDLLVGGTPCQSFSVAGLRGGLGDDRGNLALEFLKLAQRTRTKWLVWENVPGVLSSSGGRDFGSILGGLVELGYGFAYRVLDAQYFGVAQRRRRVFVVGYLGDWRPAAAVLFERHSMSGHPAPSREARQDVAGVLTSRASGGGGGPGAGTDEAAAGYLQPWPAVGGWERSGVDVALMMQAGGNSTGGTRPYGTTVDTCEALIPSTFNEDGTARTLTARYDSSPCVDRGPDVVGTLRSMSHHGSHANGGGQLAVAFDTTQLTSPHNYSNPQPGDPCHPLAAGAHPPAVAWSIMPMNSGKDYKARETEVAQPIMAGGPVGGNQGGDFVLSSKRTKPPGSIENISTTVAIGFYANEGTHGAGDNANMSPTLKAHPVCSNLAAVATQSAVRRLTPVECERLQGFPDNFTAIPWRKKGAEDCPDGPRYKALGNSMAVPVMRWIGERIQLVDDFVSLF